MKKVIVMLAFFLANVGFSQTIFDKLEDLDEVSTMVVTKDAFELLRKFPDAKSDELEVFNAAKGLKLLKVFSTSDMDTANQMEGMVKSAIRKSNLTELMRIKDKGSRVKIYVKASKNKDLVSEVLMFIRGKDVKMGNSKSNFNSVIVSLTGEIDINKLSKIADKYSKKNDKQ